MSDDEMNCAEEIASGFFASRGDASVLLEPGKEVLDQMAGLDKSVVPRGYLNVANTRRQQILDALGGFKLEARHRG